uniref:Protein FLX-like 3 n=1 Tax=Leersia perrieri TaxID=77586 RepID=A0A0D9X826_9ORYZ
MAGRHRIIRQYYDDEPRGYRDGPPPPLARARPISPRRLEEELSRRRGEMRRIRDDNQRLADEIVGLRQAMPRMKEDLHAASQVLPKLRAEKELESRELTQRNLKLEAELRSLEPLKQDALQLRSEAGKLQLIRQEMTANVQGLLKELEHQNSENKKIAAMTDERDGLRQELIRIRGILEYEKNAKPELTAQVRAMEKDLVAMAQESEKLRAEIEKRKAPSFSSHGAYGPPMVTPGMGLQGIYDGGYTSTGSRYGTGGPWAAHDPHGYPHL